MGEAIAVIIILILNINTIKMLTNKHEDNQN